MTKVFESLDMGFYNTSDQITESQFLSFWPTNMTEMKMMIETRPRYPSNKLTFTIANIAKGINIRYINMDFNSNATIDVDIFLEDSTRNFLNSFIFCFSCRHIYYFASSQKNLLVLLRECSTIT